MNRLILYIGIIIILCSGNDDSGLKFKENPPGTIYVQDSLYIDIQPVRVKDYIEFLSAINQYYSIQFKDSVEKLPDFGLDIEIFKQLKSYFPKDTLLYKRMIPRVLMTHGNDKKSWDMDFHLTNPVYSNYPVVNVSFEQAREYCKWRTTMTKLHYAIQCQNEKKRRKYPMNFVYRLPNRTEWQEVLGTYFAQTKANGLKKDPKRPNNLVSEYNIKSSKEFHYEASNVAEILDGKIVASDFLWVGGIGNISFIYYETPKDWLGFRCVCQILPEKPKISNSPLVVNVKN